MFFQPQNVSRKSERDMRSKPECPSWGQARRLERFASTSTRRPWPRRSRCSARRRPWPQTTCWVWRGSQHSTHSRRSCRYLSTTCCECPRGSRHVEEGDEGCTRVSHCSCCHGTRWCPSLPRSTDGSSRSQRLWGWHWTQWSLLLSVRFSEYGGVLFKEPMYPSCSCQGTDDNSGISLC